MVQLPQAGQTQQCSLMIDGKTTGYTSSTGFTWAGFNVPITITLNKQYTIN
jgi:hypothetical protein